ncbi:peptidase M48 [Aliifodinibius salipaludis]|uniref:Peptidase M48 n=1 Tax=Fodinibius salipaludis TaxID=2032627 RepID=A0A2A2GDR0_9BACT|nr:M48 family metallopeptidase [Aliifodinibius salipaludis]PAU94902.1 peptidase M48 [Aliifodinibius salipaludis]
MNIFAVIILATLAIDFILNMVSDYLNLKSLDTGLPEEFQDVYDEETYEKSQRYTKERTKFGILTSVFNLGLLLVFWFAGGFQWLDEMVRSWELGVIWTGLVYIGMLIFARQILSLPFSIYSTFVIEEKYGFNKTTPKTFVLDLVKGLGLSILLGGPLLAGILAFFTFIDQYAWLYAWGAVTAFTLFLQFIAPTWIMPIFNDFEPLDEESDLRQKIRDYADKVNFAMEGVYVMDGSKRSSKSNAFFTGFGKNKRIALYDTLIDNHEEDELVAVLAHEIGHYKKKHIIKNMGISIFQTGIMFFLLSIFLNSEGLFDAFFMEQMSVYAGLIFFGMLYAPIDMIVSVFMQILSRKYEFEADEFASTTYKKEPMIDALKKLSKDNLSNLTPHPFYVFLNYSHPPVLDRIKAIRATD